MNKRSRTHVADDPRVVANALTAEQAASVLGVSVATLWRWRAQGLLVGKPLLGRTVFDRGQVEALVKEIQMKRAAG